jgi:hypothetical protein
VLLLLLPRVQDPNELFGSYTLAAVPIKRASTGPQLTGRGPTLHFDGHRQLDGAAMQRGWYRCTLGGASGKACMPGAGHVIPSVQERSVSLAAFW